MKQLVKLSAPFSDMSRWRCSPTLLLLLLLGGWYLVPFVSRYNCTPQATALCLDHGDEGTMRQGGEHIVCIYQDRVIKTVKTCSPHNRRSQIINDHLRYAT